MLHHGATYRKELCLKYVMQQIALPVINNNLAIMSIIHVSTSTTLQPGM